MIRQYSINHNPAMTSSDCEIKHDLHYMLPSTSTSGDSGHTELTSTSIVKLCTIEESTKPKPTSSSHNNALTLSIKKRAKSHQFLCVDCNKLVSSARNLKRHRINCKVALAKQAQPIQENVYYNSYQIPQQQQQQQQIIESKSNDNLFPKFSSISSMCSIEIVNNNNIKSQSNANEQQQQQQQQVETSIAHRQSDIINTTSAKSPTSNIIYKCTECNRIVSSLRSLKRHRTTCKSYQLKQGGEILHNDNKKPDLPLTNQASQYDVNEIKKELHGETKPISTDLAKLQTQSENEFNSTKVKSTMAASTQKPDGVSKVADVVDSVVNRLRQQNTSFLTNDSQTNFLNKNTSQAKHSFDSQGLKSTLTNKKMGAKTKTAIANHAMTPNNNKFSNTNEEVGQQTYVNCSTSALPHLQKVENHYAYSTVVGNGTGMPTTIYKYTSQNLALNSTPKLQQLQVEGFKNEQKPIGELMTCETQNVNHVPPTLYAEQKDGMRFVPGTQQYSYPNYWLPQQQFIVQQQTQNQQPINTQQNELPIANNANVKQVSSNVKVQEDSKMSIETKGVSKSSKNVYRFLCPECDKQYSCRKNIKRHRVNTHKISLEEAQDSTPIKKIKLSEEEIAALTTRGKKRKEPEPALTSAKNTVQELTQNDTSSNNSLQSSPTKYQYINNNNNDPNLIQRQEYYCNIPPQQQVQYIHFNGQQQRMPFSAPAIIKDDKGNVLNEKIRDQECFSFNPPKAQINNQFNQPYDNNHIQYIAQPSNKFPTQYQLQNDQQQIIYSNEYCSKQPTEQHTPAMSSKTFQKSQSINGGMLEQSQANITQGYPGQLNRYHSFDGYTMPCQPMNSTLYSHNASGTSASFNYNYEYHTTNTSDIVNNNNNGIENNLADLDYWDQIKSDVDRPFESRSRADDLEMARIAEDLKRSAEGGDIQTKNNSSLHHSRIQQLTTNQQYSQLCAERQQQTLLNTKQETFPVELAEADSTFWEDDLSPSEFNKSHRNKQSTLRIKNVTGCVIEPQRYNISNANNNLNNSLLSSPSHPEHFPTNIMIGNQQPQNCYPSRETAKYNYIMPENQQFLKAEILKGKPIERLFLK